MKMRKVKLIRMNFEQRINNQNKINIETEKIEKKGCKIISVVFGGGFNWGIYALILYEVKND